jgi:hypothetical protein
MADDKKWLFPGLYFEQDKRGQLHSRGLAPELADECGMWVCRRLLDFPVMPPGGAVTACNRCNCAIVFNPNATNAPRGAIMVCMQCAGIEPGPL